MERLQSINQKRNYAISLHPVVIVGETVTIKS